MALLVPRYYAHANIGRGQSKVYSTHDWAWRAKWKEVVGKGSKAKKTQHMQHRAGRAKWNEVVGKWKRHRQWHAPRELG